MAVQFLFSVVKAFWGLASQMAPYLLLGFFIGGVLHAFLPPSIITRFMGRESMSCVTKATLVGIPLPLCSCGVLPVAASARQSGAGRAPTLAFLITTPVTGIDSILATLALLGAAFMGFRIAASFALGLIAGALAIIIPDQSKAPEPEYCPSCEKSKEASAPWARAKGALAYGLVELPESLSGSVLLGLLLGALISAAAPAELISRYIGSGIVGILVAVAIGVPLYVCATGSIPIAAAMVMKGFSPGAALAFLIAGPATNAVAFTTVKKILGTRSLIIYLVTIFIGAVGFGLVLNYFLPASLNMSAMMHEHETRRLPWYFIAGGIILLGMMGCYYFRGLVRRLSAKGGAKMKEEGNRVVLNVANMTCEHCKESIIKNLTGLENVKAVGVDLKKKKVVVSAERDIDPQVLVNSLSRVGFEAKLIEKTVPKS